MYSNELILKILDYIDINLNTKITIQDLENKLFYNRYYIMKLFKKELDITIFDYINKLRISNSIKEINNTSNKLIKVAINNGFYSLEYFSEIFKKEVGVSPREYKKITTSNYYFNEKITIITSNIIKINKIKQKVEKYRNNKKPQTLPVRKLSIFK